MYLPSVGEGEMHLKVAGGDPTVAPMRILIIFLSSAKFVTRPPSLDSEGVVKVLK